jgi:hypothetical protein
MQWSCERRQEAGGGELLRAQEEVQIHLRWQAQAVEQVQHCAHGQLESRALSNVQAAVGMA